MNGYQDKVEKALEMSAGPRGKDGPRFQSEKEIPVRELSLLHSVVALWLGTARNFPSQ